MPLSRLSGIGPGELSRSAAKVSSRHGSRLLIDGERAGNPDEPQLMAVADLGYGRSGVNDKGFLTRKVHLDLVVTSSASLEVTATIKVGNKAISMRQRFQIDCSIKSRQGMLHPSIPSSTPATIFTAWVAQPG